MQRLLMNSTAPGTNHHRSTRESFLHPRPFSGVCVFVHNMHACTYMFVNMCVCAMCMCSNV